MYVCVSKGQKCSFFGKFGALCFLVTPVLDICEKNPTLLPHLYPIPSDAHVHRETHSPIFKA